MKIGVIGNGVVGSAVSNGLRKIGNEVLIHDLILNTKINDLLSTEIIFISVPTPANDDGSCNTKIVESVVKELSDLNYDGITAIKSTVEPGTTRLFSSKFSKLNLCFVPEFLRERSAEIDFIENHDLCIIGTNDKSTFQLIKKAHGNLPKNVVMLTPTEAELAKYFNNVFNSTLITFANSFYEVCNKLDADYSNVKNAIVLRDHINNQYLDCNDNFRGFGGVCLPKDTKALSFLFKKLNIDNNFFETILKINNKLKITVYDGMRNE
jgi:UDPglucose 6-dehydrogenase